MALQKLSLAAMSFVALLAFAGQATATAPITAPAAVSALPQDPGSFFHRLQQMRQRRASYDQHTIPNPEPVTMSLLGLGGLGLAFARRRQQKPAQDS